MQKFPALLVSLITSLTVVHTMDPPLSGITNSDFEGIESRIDRKIMENPERKSLKLRRLPDDISFSKLVRLKELKRLTSLELRDGLYVTNEAFVHLNELSQLTSLELDYYITITDGAFIHLSGLTNLSKLTVRHNSKIKGEGLSHLINLPLTSLTLCSLNITNNGISSLQILTNLTSLRLYGCYNITDKGFSHFKGLTNLTSLSFTYSSNTTAEGLAHLQPLTNLTSLDLEACYITDEALANFHGLPLKFLNLFRCRGITNAGLNMMAAKLPKGGIIQYSEQF